MSEKSSLEPKLTEKQIVERLEARRPIYNTFDENGNLVFPSESEAPLRRYVRAAIDHALTHDFATDQIFQDGFETNATDYVGENSIVLSSDDLNLLPAIEHMIFEELTDITNTQGPELVATPELLFDFDPDYSRLHINRDGLEITGETALEHELAHFQQGIGEQRYIVVNFHKNQDTKGNMYPKGMECLNAEIFQQNTSEVDSQQGLKMLMAPKYPSEFDFRSAFYLTKPFLDKLRPYADDLWEEIKSGKLQIDKVQQIVIKAIQIAKKFPFWNDARSQDLIKEQLKKIPVDSEGYLIGSSVSRAFLFEDWKKSREGTINFSVYPPQMLEMPEIDSLIRYDRSGKLKQSFSSINRNKLTELH